MDYIVKFTIGLLITSILLLFFKITRNCNKNYMNNYMSPKKEPVEIIWQMP